MSLLGIDVGTTGCKAVAFNETGNILASAYREYPLISPQPGWLELDPLQVWSLVKEVIKEVTSSSRLKYDPVKAMAVSALGEAVTPIDNSGNPLYHTIIALDSRAIPQCRWWEENFSRKRIFEITGMPLHPMYSLNKILWFRDNLPEVFNHTWKFLCWEDLVYYRLGLPPTIDYSLAARTMIFDIREKKWSPQILSLANLGGEKLAEPKPSGAVVGDISGELANELGLPRGTLVATGGFDQPCAALGAGIVESGIAVDGLGTVECITPAFAHPVLSNELLEGNFPCLPHVVEGMYVSLAFSFTGGSLLRWYRDNFGLREIEEAKQRGVDPYELIIARASTHPADIFILPHFVGTGTPWLDPRSKGAILGLTLSTTKAEIIRSILEGVTYEMMLNLKTMEKAGIKLEELRATGGGAKSHLWLQLKANMFGKKVVTLNVTEGGCLAVALLAGQAAGIYPSVKDAVKEVVQIKEEFYPDPEIQSHYQERYQIYAQIYPTIAKLNHLIDEHLKSNVKDNREPDFA